MTRLGVAIALAGVLDCHRPPPAAFQGEIDLDVGGVYTFAVSLKDDETRVETSKKDGSPVIGPIIVNGTTAYALDRSTRQAFVVDASSQPKSVLVPKDTGKKEIVAGHGCSVVEVADAATKTTLCIAWDLPLLRASLGVTSGGKEWLPEFGKGSTGFPLRIVVTGADGAILGKGEAMRIEAKPIPDSLFEVPAGYARVPMPSK